MVKINRPAAVKPAGLFLTLVFYSCTQHTPDNLARIKGNATLPDFYIGKYEVTQKEWSQIMRNNPSEFKGDDLPVETVSWYDCVEYCNKRSIKEGLRPYYNIDKNKKDPDNTSTLDDIKWTVMINKGANGYRLPTETEWEYAAGGGRMSKRYTYSGSNNLDEVGWYWQNAGDNYLTGTWSWPALEKNNNRTRPVGRKAPNELGLYDMSGNVREWCWDPHTDTGSAPRSALPPEGPQGRVWKGGGWMGADFCCQPSFHALHEANGKGPDQGFRLCRNVDPAN